MSFHENISLTVLPKLVLGLATRGRQDLTTLFTPVGNPDMFEGLCDILGCSFLRRFDLVTC